jgi:acyl-CoA dehydrogenase
MDFSLNEEQRHWQSEARRFAEEEIRPLSLERDQIADPRETWDWDIIIKGSKLGFRTLAVPKEWGGPGADFVTQAIVMAELARGDSAISKAFSQNWKWSHLIAASCTREQKERFLKPFLADHKYLMGRGITEPNAGSDNRMPPPDAPKAGYRLKAERDGEEWVLNGEKCFIANGSVGSLFFVDARTNPEVNVRQGGTLFMVPKGTPGFRAGKVFNKRGWRFYQNAELIFENCRIPHSNVVGEVNGGVRASAGDTTGGDIFGDLELAANAVGVCDDAIAMAWSFARSHKRAGKLVLEHQLVQLKLNEMHAHTEALRSYVMRVAWERDQGGPVGANAGLAMNLSTDIIQRVTRLNMEIHGPEGCMMHARVDKLVRDAMVWTHLAGDTVQRVKILKRLQGTQAPSAGAH